MLPIRKSIELSLLGTERERTEKLLTKVDAVNAMNKRWGEGGTDLMISLEEYKAYDHFLELEPDETELELMNEDGQIIRTSMRELRGRYNLEEAKGRFPLIQRLHQLKAAGSEGNSAWRNNWAKIASAARKLKTALRDEY